MESPVLDGRLSLDISSNGVPSTLNKLNLLHHLLKTDRLHQKADQILLDKVELYATQIIKSIDECLVEGHELLYKSEADRANLPKLEAFKETTVKLNSNKTYQALIRIFNHLRKDPHYLAHALYFDSYLSPSSKEKRRTDAVKKLQRTIASGLFRHCFCIEEENLFLKYLSELFSYSKEFVNRSRLQLPEFLSDTIQLFVRYTIVNEYFQVSLKDILLKIIEETKTEDITKDFTPLAKEILAIIISPQNVIAIPYGIRVLANIALRTAKELDLDANQTFAFMKDVLFDSFYFQCFFRPDVFANLKGSDLKTRRFIPVLSKLQLQIMEPSNFDSVMEWFKKVADIEMLKVEDGSALYLNAFFTKSEIEMLFEPLYKVRETGLKEMLTGSNPTYKLSNPDDPLGKLIDQFIILERNPQTRTEYGKIYFRNLIFFTLPQRENASKSQISGRTSGAPVPTTVKEAKRKLSHVLSTIAGFSPEPKSLLDVLESELKYWHSNQASSIAQIQEAIRGLHELPENYKQSDFALLIDEMITEVQERAVDEASRVNQQLYNLDRLQSHLNRVRYHVNNFAEQFIDRKIKDETFLGKFNSFKDNFIQDFGKKKDYNEKSNSVKEFIGELKKMLKGHELWANSKPQEIWTTLKHLERTVMTELFYQSFRPNPEDGDIKTKVVALQDLLTLKDFEIPAKFHSEAPWPLAQAEIKALNSYRAPHDKFLCISRCWEILSHCVSMLDDPAPDSLWPIMGWVIQSSSVDDILANIDYIENFTILDDKEESRLMAFRSAVDVLKETLTYKQDQLRSEDKKSSNSIGNHRNSISLLK